MKTGVHLPAAPRNVLRDLPTVPGEGGKGGGAPDASRSGRPGAGYSRLAGSGETRSWFLSVHGRSGCCVLLDGNSSSRLLANVVR